MWRADGGEHFAAILASDLLQITLLDAPLMDNLGVKKVVMSSSPSTRFTGVCYVVLCYVIMLRYVNLCYVMSL
jgi:hypothetical protein